MLPGLVSILPGLKQDLSHTNNANNASVHIIFDGLCQAHSVSGLLLSTGRIHDTFKKLCVGSLYLGFNKELEYMTNLIFSISRKNKMKL